MLVYAEKFSSLCRLDNDSSHPKAAWSFPASLPMPSSSNGDQILWNAASVPYTYLGGLYGGGFRRSQTDIVGGTPVPAMSGEMGNHWSANSGRVIYMHTCFARSRNVVGGFLVRLRANSQLQFLFCSAMNSSTQSSNFAQNFRISITSSNDRQKHQITFQAGDGSYPQISSATVYYDLTAPTWIWVQCNMINATATQGVARVWFGNDLMVSREGIVSGHINTWAGQPLYEFNNAIRVHKPGEYRNPVDVYGIIVVNEGMSYMDSALGDVGLASFSPSGVDPRQWEPHFGGHSSETAPSELLGDNKFLDASSYHSAKHMRASDDAMRDLCTYAVPLPLGTEIVAAAHSVSHRKATISGDTSKIKVEPVIYTESREPLTNRSYGNLSESNIRALHIPYTVPYPGALWTDEILHATKFGYAYNDIKKHELVHAEANLLGEYDVENLEDSVSLESEASEAEEA